MFSGEISSYFPFSVNRMLIKDVNGALVSDLGCAEKRDMKTLNRNQTKLLLWSENVQYQSAVIYENTFSRFPSPRCLALMIISSRKMSFIRPPMAKREKAIFLLLVLRSQWMGKQTFQTDDDGPQEKKRSIYYTHIYIYWPDDHVKM